MKKLFKLILCALSTFKLRSKQVGEFFVCALCKEAHTQSLVSQRVLCAYITCVRAEIFHRRLCTSRLVVNVAVRVNSGYARSMSREKRTRSVAVIGAYIILYPSFSLSLSSKTTHTNRALYVKMLKQHFLPLCGALLG